MDFDEVEMMIF